MCYFMKILRDLISKQRPKVLYGEPYKLSYISIFWYDHISATPTEDDAESSKRIWKKCIKFEALRCENLTNKKNIAVHKMVEKLSLS